MSYCVNYNDENICLYMIYELNQVILYSDANLKASHKINQ